VFLNFGKYLSDQSREAIAAKMHLYAINAAIPPVPQTEET
jgi:hypothetical protein